MNWLWGIKICKLNLIWRWFWNAEIENFWVPKPFIEKTNINQSLKKCQQHCIRKCTGCKRRIRKIFEVKIWKESLLVKEQTIPQQKALDLSFSLASWKWAWHYHEAATPSHRRITFFTPRQPMLFTAREHGALLMMPSPLSGCQIKAEIKGFLLMNSLFLY